MNYHLIYMSDSEQKVLEIDTNDVRPNIGDYVQLPFGEIRKCTGSRPLMFITRLSVQKRLFSRLK